MASTTLRLTPHQRLLMHFMTREAEEDAVGLEFSELEGRLLRSADSLVAKGLVEFYGGWDFTFWYRLTPDGRRVLAE